MSDLVLLLLSFSLFVQLGHCDNASFQKLAHPFSHQLKDGQADLLLANLSSHAVEFGPQGELISRQRQCVDPGYGMSPLGNPVAKTNCDQFLAQTNPAAVQLEKPVFL
jgi:hypothetical protein